MTKSQHYPKQYDAVNILMAAILDGSRFLKREVKVHGTDLKKKELTVEIEGEIYTLKLSRILPRGG